MAVEVAAAAGGGWLWSWGRLNVDGRDCWW